MRDPAMAQQRGAVTQTALAGQLGRRRFEYRQLRRDTRRAVCVAEVRHQRHLLHLRQRIDPHPGGAVALRCETKSVHAGIHFQENPVRRVRLVRRQQIDLLFAVHRVPQIQSRAQLQVTRVECAFEQQHRAAPAQFAHPFGLAEVEQCEAVGRLQRFEHPLDPVPVGVGLDHRPDPGIGRCAFGPRQILAQCVCVNGGVNGTRHGGLSAQDGASPDSGTADRRAGVI